MCCPWCWTVREEDFTKNLWLVSSSRFINAGGYRLLNSWIKSSMSTNDTTLLRRILLVLKKLPLRVEHLKMVLSSSDNTQLQKTALFCDLTLIPLFLPEQHSQVGVAAQQKGRDRRSVPFLLSCLTSIYLCGYGCNTSPVNKPLKQNAGKNVTMILTFSHFTRTNFQCVSCCRPTHSSAQYTG